ncbi:MAG: M60 family metallopeptidase, partial [Eubacteriales bacterium]|nr:M60 family metallopeptidase [Eubacteriales bacterium]
VVAKNDVGESPNSDLVEATPKKEIIVPPTLPEKDRISNSNIESVEMGHKDNYDTNLYPNGFNTEWLYDENYETSWVARAWWETNSFKFTFKEAKDMDYLIWVPRLDGEYRKSISRYNIDVWLEGDDLTKPGTRIAEERSISNRGEDDSYYVLDFPKQEKVKKIEIKVIQWNGSPTNTSASEVAFYEYNDISDKIDRLFKNSSKTELANGVTETEIDKLKEEISDITGFVLNKDILLNELEIARGLLKGDNSVLGVIKDNIYSINTSKDAQKYQTINDFQPLGVVGAAKQQIVVYADIPEGETVQLVPTQFYSEANALTGNPVTLNNGRNIITIPKIGSLSYDRGGSLYVTYSGDKASEIKLQVVGGTKIPYLELKDFYSLSEEEAKAKIKDFILEVEALVPTLKGNLTNQILNSTEISLPQVLLSLPANKILEGIKSDNTTDINAQVDKVYNTILAWEEFFDVAYKVYGIDDTKTDGLESRQNIRYTRMFGNAFMYAAGNHIGIGYNSVPALMNGKPSSNISEADTSNSLFGWGIAHEVGHVLDRLGKAEVTNNIYSLMLQTYDGKANTLPSRLETSNVYQKIFNKVSVGNEGIPNDVFVHLGMYWQLHLAYDNEDNPFNFYNELHKAYRTDESLKSFNDMDKFAVASSNIVQKDLTKFFTRWGVKLSEEAKNAMSAYPEEDRAIYYLTDESRRQRIKGNSGNTNISVTANAQVNADNPKEVNITITGENDNVQGYEIIRNGKSIGFTTTKEFTDIINSANNMAFNYEVVPVDILGNISPKVSAGEIRISYDNTIDKSLYQISITDSSNSLVTFNEPTIITGIKITPKTGTDLPTGNYTVSIKVAGEENGEEYIVAKDGDFSVNLSKDTNAYVGYFNKPGDTSDKMWSYDAVSLKLTGIDTSLYNVDFISYPGDNIEFLDMGIGRLASDYDYGDGTIKAGTLIIVGNYRGSL